MRLVLSALLSSSLTVAPAPEPSDRAVEGPTSVAWPDDAPEPEVQGQAADAAEGEAESPPPPQAARPGQRTVRVAVGLDPSAPGTRVERKHLGTLQKAVESSTEITVDTRRLRVGAPTAREVCRDGRDDLVVLIGYVPQRPEPVLLPYDCGLDVPLAVRGIEAADEPELVAALWYEHEQLVRNGVQERRQGRRLGPKARAGIVAGVVVVVVGVAVGLLVANALRDETVVLTVGP